MIEILTGLISGIASGTGQGGGTILILVLSFFLGISQHTAQATNIIFYVPTAIVAIIVSFKQKLINVKTGIIAIIFGSIGVVVGAKIAIYTNGTTLKKYFGIFLLLIAIYEIYEMFREYILKAKRNNKDK